MAFVELTPQIPTPDGLTQNLEVAYSLEGVTYGFRFYVIKSLVNDSSQWCFDIFDPDSNTDILVGLRLIVGLNLLRPYQKYKTLPPGALLVADLRTTSYDPLTQTWSGIPGFDPIESSFSEQTHKLIYITSDDPALEGRT